jgi:DNA-binding MarR family transcriptional regulator
MAHSDAERLAGPGVLDEGILRSHVDFQVHNARRAIRRALRRVDDGTPGAALPGGSFSALELIGRNRGIAPHALAERLFLDAPKVTLLLRRLTAEGLVERSRSARDRRRAELRLTPAGAERLEGARRFSALQEARIARALSAVERARLLDLLGKLQDGLR